MGMHDLPLRAAPELARPTTAVEVGSAGAGADPGQVAEAVAGGLAALTLVSDVAHRLGTQQLTELLGDALVVLQRAEAAAVALAGEVASRGLVAESTAGNLTQLVARLATGEPAHALFPPAQEAASGPLVPLDPADGVVDPDGGDGAGSDANTARRAQRRPPVPGLEPADAHRIAQVAIACTQRKNALIDDALRGGEVSTRCAAAALKHAEKVMPLLPSHTREQVVGHYLALPSDAGVRAVRELTRRIIATYATEDSLDRADERLDAVESLTWSQLDNGMTRLVADLTAEHGAQLRAAISALSAPAPCHDCCDDPHHRHTGTPTGEPDSRTPTTRRADALMLLAVRGSGAVDDDGSVLTRGPVRLVVTVGLDILRGSLAGYGLTDDGTSLTAAQVRRLACDTSVVPMVLGTDGQPLDVGREARLATPAIRQAVAHRDRCCTYPGCGRPPSWCQVHHITPWWAGGATSLANSTLLCQRHHTVVHRDRLTAQIVDGRIRWDLTPGRMVTSQTPAA